MKKFIFIYSATEAPTEDTTQLWMDWFATVGDKIVDSGNPLIPGIHVTEKGAQEIKGGSANISGYSIFNAENVDEAEKIALGCPLQDILIYEALPM